jgi:hypothetical protein
VTGDGEAMNHRLFKFWVGPGPMWKFFVIRWGPLELVVIFARGCFGKGQRLWCAESAGTRILRVGPIQGIWRESR